MELKTARVTSRAPLASRGRVLNAWVVVVGVDRILSRHGDIVSTIRGNYLLFVRQITRQPKLHWLQWDVCP